MRSPRLWLAIAALTLLGVMAATTLVGKFRQAVLILLVGVAVRLVIGRLIDRQPTSPSPSETPKSL